MTTVVEAILDRASAPTRAKGPLAKLYDARFACRQLRAAGATPAALERFAEELCDSWGASVVAIVYGGGGLSTEIAVPADAVVAHWAARLSSMLRPSVEQPVLSLAGPTLPSIFRDRAVGRVVLARLEIRGATSESALLLGWPEDQPLHEDERAALALLGQDVAAALEGAALDDRLTVTLETRDKLVDDLRRQRQRLEIAIGDVERAREFERRRAEQLKEVSRLSAVLSSELELPALLHKITEALLTVTSAEYAALVLPSEGGRGYVVGGVAGRAADDLGAIGPMDDRGIIELVIGQGQTIFVNDVRLHPRLQSLVPRQRSLLGVPLRWRDRIVGGLLVGHADPGRFGTYDLELVSTLGTQAAIAIENARLVSEHAQRTLELRAVLDQMAEGVWATNTDGRLVLINRAALALHGFGPAEPPPTTSDGLGARVRAESCEGKIHTFVPTGDEAPTMPRSVLLSSVDLHGPSGARTGTVTVATDMTDLKRLERAKDEFLSLAAHELRTPLTPMTMLLQSLERKARAGLVDLDAIVRTRRQVVRLTKLINDLLDFSRVNAQRLEISPAPLDLAQLVSEVVDTFRSTAQKHTIEIAMTGAPYYVNGDKSRLEQVVVNLIDNAVKYSPTGGLVRVQASRAEGHVSIAVEDQGIGIPAEEKERLFERFFRAENASNRKFQGFGLGLYLAHAIVARHGGSMSVESELGKGSRFTFRVPLIEPESVRRRPKTAPRVLLIDDDPDILHVAGDILEEEGYEVVRAHDGAEALRHLDTALPDVILLDLMMPVADGWDVLGRLRNAERWCQVPIIVLSAHDALAEQAAALHADAWLGKPFEVDALVRKVGELVPVARASVEP